jgi:hypothetical protein
MSSSNRWLRAAFAAYLLTIASAFAQDSEAVRQSGENKPTTAASSEAGKQDQEKKDTEKSDHAKANDEGDKRVFGVLPNYRTVNETAVYTPISTKYKMTIAAKDSFDYPLVGVAAVFASFGQLTNQNPSFGQGMAGFGRRLGTGYADQAIGNMLTEGILPSLLHEDPRYFRRGHGSVKGRTGYALSRIFITKTDSGGSRFNYSEWVGNAIGVGISNSYLPDQRNVSDNVSKLLTQCGTDAISQVLKEFWPDIKHKLFHKKDAN